VIVLFPERPSNVIVNVAPLSLVLAVRFERATMRLNQPPRKRQAKAEPLVVARHLAELGHTGHTELTRSVDQESKLEILQRFTSLCLRGRVAALSPALLEDTGCVVEPQRLWHLATLGSSPTVADPRDRSKHDRFTNHLRGTLIAKP
jgi:hypothetical protein